MLSLDEKFQDLKQRLRSVDRFRNTGDDPIYYLIYPVREVLKARKKIPLWKTQLELEGYEVHELSLGKLLLEFFDRHPLRPLILDGEKSDPTDFAALNASLGPMAAPTGQEDVLTPLVRQKLAELKGKKAVLFLTDIEGLHPHLKIGAIEQRLQGQCPVPVVIFYPGSPRGRSVLKYLEIYPEDGNYRSIHIG